MIKKEIIVKQHNDLIRKSIYNTDLTINELKIFRAIITQINNNDTLFNDFYTIDYNLLDLVGIDKKNRFKIVRTALKHLANTYVFLDDEKKIECGLIHNKFIYKKNSSKIVVTIDSDLQPLLLQIKEYYTQYNISHIQKFNSIYTMKIYELMKSWQSNYEFEISITELREYLQIDDSKYTKYANFKQRIIIKSIDEIEQYSDIVISIREIKNSNKVEYITFKIKSKDEQKQIKKEQQSELTTELIDDLMVHFGIAQKSDKMLIIDFELYLIQKWDEFREYSLTKNYKNYNESFIKYLEVAYRRNWEFWSNQ